MRCYLEAHRGSTRAGGDAPQRDRPEEEHEAEEDLGAKIVRGMELAAGGKIAERECGKRS